MDQRRVGPAGPAEAAFAAPAPAQNGTLSGSTRSAVKTLLVPDWEG